MDCACNCVKKFGINTIFDTKVSIPIAVYPAERLIYVNASMLPLHYQSFYIIESARTLLKIRALTGYTGIKFLYKYALRHGIKFKDATEFSNIMGIPAKYLNEARLYLSDRKSPR